MALAAMQSSRPIVVRDSRVRHSEGRERSITGLFDSVAIRSGWLEMEGRTQTPVVQVVVNPQTSYERHLSKLLIIVYN